jgi:branched-subunit amino acid transport protein AzlD
MNDLQETLILIFAMAVAIFFCRAFPFLFFGRVGEGEKSASRRSAAFINFVEKVVPPVAMTVLSFNALGGAFRNTMEGLLGLGAAVFTAIMHLWKRNALISIFGGTALYMILIRVIL